MYRIFCPVLPSADNFDPNAALSALESAGADLVYLVMPDLTYAGFSDEVLEKTGEAVEFFRSHGLEVGIWLWSLLVKDAPDFTPIRGIDGRISAVQKCPSDENFVKFMEEQYKAVARLHPDRIQLDDDLRFAALDSGCGCLCENHMVALENILQSPVNISDVLEKWFSAGPNKGRSACLKVWGDSLRNYVSRLREAVDSVDPSIRMGGCACIGTFDLDGSDMFELTKILAGKNKPFLRLSGAPYWESGHNCGCRLPDIIELERMERSWYTESDMEIVSEGDTYPRPRWKVPAAWLEIFDSALQADGTLDGILKYPFDYSASFEYERGYLKRHMKNMELDRNIRRIFDGKSAEGIRVWAPMKTVEMADYSDKAVSARFLNRRFFAVSARTLASSAFPTVYTGTGQAGISFGESARYLPDDAYKVPLILDLGAARRLSASGIDVGLRGIGKMTAADTLNYAPRDTGVLQYSGNEAFAILTLHPEAEVIATFCKDKKEYPFAYRYKNASGQRFLVFSFDEDAADEEVWRNYLYPAIIHDAMEAFGIFLPVRTEGDPDLYLQCKRGDGQLAVGLWNCSADPIDETLIKLPGNCKQAEFIGCTGSFGDKSVTVDLPAFGYGAILITEK